jgi:hypothetical protein
LDNGENEPESVNASKKKALAEDKLKGVIHHGRRDRRRARRTYLHDTAESGEKSTAVEEVQPCNRTDKGISIATYKIKISRVRYNNKRKGVGARLSEATF